MSDVACCSLSRREPYEIGYIRGFPVIIGYIRRFPSQSGTEASWPDQNAVSGAGVRHGYHEGFPGRPQGGARESCCLKTRGRSATAASKRQVHGTSPRARARAGSRGCGSLASHEKHTQKKTQKNTQALLPLLQLLHGSCDTGLVPSSAQTGGWGVRTHARSFFCGNFPRTSWARRQMQPPDWSPRKRYTLKRPRNAGL